MKMLNGCITHVTSCHARRKDKHLIFSNAFFRFQVVEDIDSETVGENLSEIVPGLIRVNNWFMLSYVLLESFFIPSSKQFVFFFQCYDHVESSVRKASVFCLVAIHSSVGEETLMPHLAELSGTKVRIYPR